MDAIRAELADPAQDTETVLSLALAAGYNSLSAFNRAFKAAEGCSPSAFRAACQARLSASTPNSADTVSET
ncbi:helix-turn-helix domain-containing protein [Paucibacter sp. DJ1R-11]|uniref:helix-turn-helix domain-containing protein n=1 Tax=Paucibacter sp. DJ1R-11 TaxID=2893556 RepID=UPI00398C6BDA